MLSAREAPKGAFFVALHYSFLFPYNASMALAWQTLFTNDDVSTQTFVDNLRRNIDEDTEDLISDIQILAYLKEALTDISEKADLNVSLATTTCDGSAYYELPDGLNKLGSIYYVDTGGRVQLLRKGSQSLAYSFGQSSTSTQAQFYTRRGNQIHLFGSPTSGTLQVYGVREPEIPSSISSSIYIDLPKQFIQLCYKYVEWMYWRRVRDADQTIICRDEYKEAIRDAAYKAQKEYSRGVVMYGQRA